MKNPLKSVPAKYRQALYALVSVAGTLVAIPGLVPGPYQVKVAAAVAAATNLLAIFHVTPEG